MEMKVGLPFAILYVLVGVIVFYLLSKVFKNIDNKLILSKSFITGLFITSFISCTLFTIIMPCMYTGNWSIDCGKYLKSRFFSDKLNIVSKSDIDNVL
jgi:hypothetical protein